MPKDTEKPLILTERLEEILRAIHVYRYMTALDVAYLFYSPRSINYVRALLSKLSGGEDFKPNQYLYRFRLPSAAPNSERVYTLGSRGRDFLARQLGIPVDWYFRPEKVRHFGYNQLLHNLILTRFLVAANAWATRTSDFRLRSVRISYELAQAPPSVQIVREGKSEVYKVIPDAWLLFEQVKQTQVESAFPILLEIDRGTTYRQKFKERVAQRVEFVRSGAYQKVFGTKAVMIAYATTGETDSQRQTRCLSMGEWTKEVLAEIHKKNWASIFRFHGLALKDIYSLQLFEEPVWYRPDSSTPVTLFTP
jgi:hypothetical protein